MKIQNSTKTLKIITFALSILLLILPKTAVVDDGTFTKIIYSIGKNSLTEHYDVFTDNNKKFTLKLGDINSYKYLILEKVQQSNYINIRSSNMMKGDGRYSRPRSGKIEIKFDNDEKIYDLGGTSYYLRYTTTSIYKDKHSEFIEKLASKRFMYVKVSVLGQDFVFKVNLEGLVKMLKTGTFI